MLSEWVYKLQIALGGVIPQRSLNLPPADGQHPQGRALVSYKPLPMFGDPGLFRGHSSVWESSEIVHIFSRMGFDVDLIDWNDSTFAPHGDYDVVFDIHRNLLHYGGTTSRRIFHVTGSHPDFSNKAEQQRLKDLQERRGVLLQQRRGVHDADLRLFSENLEAADLITLIGNEVTLSTFSPVIQPKIVRISATGSIVPHYAGEPTGEHRDEFLWFNGAGAVHKGLDLTLEVFARNPQLTLHIVGPYAKEHDFVEAYRHELTMCSNIHAHGFMYPGGRKFQEIVARVRAFVNPSCSEGISTSSITCMQYGLIPILSKQAGITLPPGMGKTLENCTTDELEEAVLEIAAKHPREVEEMSGAARDHAQSAYSRQAFSSLMEQALRTVISGHRGTVQ